MYRLKRKRPNRSTCKRLFLQNETNTATMDDPPLNSSSEDQTSGRGGNVPHRRHSIAFMSHTLIYIARWCPITMRSHVRLPYAWLEICIHQNIQTQSSLARRHGQPRHVHHPDVRQEPSHGVYIIDSLSSDFPKTQLPTTFSVFLLPPVCPKTRHSNRHGVLSCLTNLRTFRLSYNSCGGEGINLDEDR